MDRKKVLVTAVVGVVLAALAYFVGPDVVNMVRNSVEVAPVSTETGE